MRITIVMTWVAITWPAAHGITIVMPWVADRPFAEIQAGATSITLAIAVRITIVMDVAPAWTSANDKKCTLL